MGPIFRTVKRIFFWRFDRTAWQYDILCVLILVFIFLTPKSWFENSERTTGQGHQNPVQRVYFSVDKALTGQLELSEVERRVREVTGKPETRVISYHPTEDSQGKSISYEVDIR